jgi:hypothetical protein
MKWSKTKEKRHNNSNCKVVMMWTKKEVEKFNSFQFAFVKETILLTKHPNDPRLALYTPLRITAFPFIVVQHFTLSQFEPDKDVKDANERHWNDEKQKRAHFEGMLKNLIFHLE